MPDVSSTANLVAQMTTTTGNIIDASLPLIWFILGIITAFIVLGLITKYIKKGLKIATR